MHTYQLRPTHIIVEIIVITRLSKQKHKTTKVILIFCLTLDLAISEFIQKWVNILPQCNVDVY